MKNTAFSQFAPQIVANSVSFSDPFLKIDPPVAPGSHGLVDFSFKNINNIVKRKRIVYFSRDFKRSIAFLPTVDVPITSNSVNRLYFNGDRIPAQKLLQRIGRCVYVSELRIAPAV